MAGAADMVSDALTSHVSDDFLKQFESRYNEEYKAGEVSHDTAFQYAWCLIRSRQSSDVKKGISILEDLLKNKDAVTQRRDYYYYLAVGYARSKDYNTALKYIKTLLQMEPGNQQAQTLEKEIRSSMNSDAFKGAAIAGGGLLAGAAIVGLGLALLKRH